MLIDSFKEGYRELTGQSVAAQPEVKIQDSLPAANASHFGKSEVQARRHRRQRRFERFGQRSMGGWKLRAW